MYTYLCLRRTYPNRTSPPNPTPLSKHPLFACSEWLLVGVFSDLNKTIIELVTKIIWVICYADCDITKYRTMITFYQSCSFLFLFLLPFSSLRHKAYDVIFLGPSNQKLRRNLICILIYAFGALTLIGLHRPIQPHYQSTHSPRVQNDYWSGFSRNSHRVSNLWPKVYKSHVMLTVISPNVVRW